MRKIKTKLKNWFKHKKEQEKQEETPMSVSSSSPYIYSTIPTITSVTTTSTGTGVTMMPSYGYGGSFTVTSPGGGYSAPYTATGTAGMAGTYGSFSYVPPPNIISFSSTKGEIVKLNHDGSVTWTNGEIKIDEAAEAFAKAISMGAEMAAGVTNGIKLRMRDSVFEDLIAIAKEKGSLTAEELTYLLQASKIVEKLKGAKD